MYLGGNYSHKLNHTQNPWTMALSFMLFVVVQMSVSNCKLHCCGMYPSHISVAVCHCMQLMAYHQH